MKRRDFMKGVALAATAHVASAGSETPHAHHSDCVCALNHKFAQAMLDAQSQK